MLTKVFMPEVSITTAEVTLVAWIATVGDRVTRGSPLFTVETDKATMDVEAFMDGYLREIYFQAGQVVPLEAAVALISTTPDEPLAPDAAIATPTPETVASDLQATEQKAEMTASPTQVERIIASPIARQLALEHQVDLATLKGSGPGGRITSADVEAIIQSRQAVGAPTPGKPSSEITTSMRKAIAQRTLISKTTIPHYYVSIDFDMSHVLDVLEQAKQVAETEGETIPTVTDVLIWACGQILPRHPYLNASWIDDEIRLHDEINIGMVVGVEGGLMVPVINQANTLSLSQVAALTSQLKAKTLAGTLTMSEIGRSTFTISNLGMFGVSNFIAVINPPESAILALAAIQKKLVVGDQDAITIQPLMTATLSADHRVVDGIAAAKFLKDLNETLAHF